MRSLFVTLFLFPLFILEAAHPSVVREEFVFSNPPFESCHASTLTEADGHLLCAWFGGTKEGDPDVKIWMSHLKSTWEAPQEIASADNFPCWNPVLFTLPSKEVLLFYKAGRNPKEWSGFLKRSLDHGMTWSAPEFLPAGIIGPVRSKPLLLDNGTLLCGSSIESWQRWGCWMDITSDGGRTWTKSNPINVATQYFGIIQPTVFFSKNGTLRLLARSHQIGYICAASSEDKGKTWTVAKPTSLLNPNSAIETVNLKDGRILLVYNDSKIERYPLNLAVSSDGGETWEMKVILEDKEGEYSYPAMIQTQDGLVHITYTWNRKQIKHVVLDPDEI